MWDIKLFEEAEQDFEVKSGVRARRRALLADPLSGSVLEIGAGIGPTWVSGAYDDPSRFPRVVMVEPTPTLRERIVERLRDEGAKGGKETGHIEVMDGRLPSLAFEDEEFDVVACFFIVSHLEERDAGIKEVVRLLKKGGTLLLMDHALHYRDSTGKIREHKDEPATKVMTHKQSHEESTGDDSAGHPTHKADHAEGSGAEHTHHTHGAEHTHGGSGDHHHSTYGMHDQSPKGVVDLFAAVPELTIQGEYEEFMADTGRSGPIRCAQAVFKKT